MTSTALRREVGLATATAMVAGTIIGASIFVQPSVITARAPSAGGIALAWTLAGVLTLLGALIAAELATAYPRSGGVYLFLREAFGPWLGFLWGWAMFWMMHTGIIAAIAVVFGRYAGRLLGFGDAGIRALAIGAVLLLTLVNVSGVKAGGRVQAALTAVKVGVVALLAAAAFLLGPREAVTVAAAPTATFGIGDMALAVAAGLFAFGGWHMVTYTAGETVDPERAMPRALIIGTLLVTACYLALNAAYLHVLPLDRLIASRAVAADAADAVLGSGGAALATAVVLVSTFGAINGIVLTGPRVYWAMAQDRLLFAWAGAVHPRFQTPHRALWLQALWAAVLIATAGYEQLFGRVIYTEWLFFGLMALGLLRLRGRPGYAPRFRLPIAPLLAGLFAAASFAVAAAQVAERPKDAAVGLGLVVAGLPVYLLWTRLRRTDA